MSNTTGTLSSALVTLRVMEFLREQFPLLSAISTDFSDATADFNQQIISRVITPPAVADYSTSVGYAAANTTATDVPVTLDHFRHVTVGFNTTELSGTKRNLIDEQAKPAAYSLGKDLVDHILADITEAHFPTEIIETAANTDRTTLGTLRTALNGQGASPFNRFAIFGSSAFGYLTDDAKIISNEYNPNNTDDQRAVGLLRNIRGFSQVIEYPSMPSTNSLSGFGGSPASLVVATRIPKDPALLDQRFAGAGSVQVITDPDTGMSMLCREWYDWTLGQVFYTLAWMFGTDLGVAAQGCRVSIASTT